MDITQTAVRRNEETGKFIHDENVPTIEFSNGAKVWCDEDGGAHRLSGPALNFPDHPPTYNIRGVDITKELTEWCEQKEINMDQFCMDDMLAFITETGFRIEDNKKVFG